MAIDDTQEQPQEIVTSISIKEAKSMIKGLQEIISKVDPLFKAEKKFQRKLFEWYQQKELEHHLSEHPELTQEEAEALKQAKEDERRGRIKSLIAIRKMFENL